MADQREYTLPQNHRRDYKPGHPDIFVHQRIVDRFGPLNVDYDSQASLHEYEIPAWLSQDTVPGWPWPPEEGEVKQEKNRPKLPDPTDVPAVYIDVGSPESEHLAPLQPPPLKKLSHDSLLKDDEIHINLRTFSHGGRIAITQASITRLSRELILQSAARAIAKNNKLIRPSDIKHEYWFPTSIVGTGLFTSWLSEWPAPTMAAIALAAIAAVPNSFELFRDTPNERVKAMAVPMVQGLIRRHDKDFSFPGRS